METMLAPHAGAVNPRRTVVGVKEDGWMRHESSRTTWRQILDRLQREHSADEILAAARAIVEREVGR